MKDLLKRFDNDNLKDFILFLWTKNYDSKGEFFEKKIVDLIEDSYQFRNDHFTKKEGTKIWRWEMNETITVHLNGRRDPSKMSSFSKISIVLWFTQNECKDPEDMFELKITLRIPFVEEQLIEKSFFSTNKIDIISHEHLDFSFNPFSQKTPIDLDILNQLEKQYGDIKLKLIKTIYDKVESIINDSILEFTNLKVSKKNIFVELDKDNNGVVDIIEGDDDFMNLLKKYKEKIIENDKSYVQKFVKVFNYLKNKRENIQNIFISLKDTRTQSSLDDEIGILKNQIYSYNLLLFHSINMIVSLVDDDLITFYEIYESFDKLNMFNSNWENEVSQKLTNIGDGIKDLLYSINLMETNIIHSISRLTYVTQNSFSKLSNSVEKQLSSIDSSIKFNNLLTGIQTYQMYKINQNTKRTLN